MVSKISFFKSFIVFFFNFRYINDEAAQGSWVEESLSKTEAQLYHTEARLTMNIGSRYKIWIIN